MTRKEIESKLQAMLNRPYYYGGHVHTITSYDLNEESERVYIYTDRNGIDPFDRKYDSIHGFLKRWDPVNNLTPALQAKQDTIVSPVNSTISQLQTILLDNIEKVKKDANYIPQAKAINNDVNSIINLAKIQVMLIKNRD